MLARKAQFDQQLQASQGRRTGARGHQLDLLQIFANHLDRIEQGRTHDDGSTVLVVVENRYFHALAQAPLDIKTVWRLDVFQVDSAKGGLERGDDVHQFVEIVFFVDLDVKDIDAGKLFEQHRLALHHRLGGQGPNVAEPEDGGAIGDHRHQIAAAGVLKGLVRVFDDFLARRCNTGRISQGQVMLVDQLLGRCNGDLARCGEFVVFQRGTAQLSVFVFGVGLVVWHVCLLQRPVSNQSRWVAGRRVIVGRPKP